MFSISMHSEAIEACRCSIGSAVDFTEETLASVEDERARAVVGAIRDHLRNFRDAHHGTRTPDRWHRRHEPWWDESDGGVMSFFTDLGGLRDRVRTLLGVLAELEPGIRPNKLLDGVGSEP